MKSGKVEITGGLRPVSDVSQLLSADQSLKTVRPQVSVPGSRALHPPFWAVTGWTPWSCCLSPVHTLVAKDIPGPCSSRLDQGYE